MSAPDPQQPRVLTPPRSGPAAASNDRRANDHPPRPASGVGTRGGSSSDEAILLPAPIRPTSRRSISQPSADMPPKGGPAAEAAVPEQQSHLLRVTQAATAPLLWDPVLHMLAAGLDDIEQTRIAQEHRYRILTAAKADSDGQTRGFGLDDSHPSVAAIRTQIETLKFLDKQMTKALEKQLRTHPLHPWIKAQKGLGDKTIARLFGCIRDPYWHDGADADGEPLNRPRTVGELFAYCGVAGPGQRRTRGVKTRWSPDARKRLYVIADCIVKSGGPYRAVYDQGRAKYAEKTHTEPCAQCGTPGKPAQVGSDWRDGHKHAAARRLVMREVLRDLWLEARGYYAEQTGASAPVPSARRGALPTERAYQPTT